MSRWRIFATDRPTRRFGPILPLDPAEQRVLDELRRRREDKPAEHRQAGTRR